MPNEEDFKQMQLDIAELQQQMKVMADHNHLGVDGSREFDGRTIFQGKGVVIAGGITTGGRLILPLVVTDGVDQEWLKPGAGQRQAASGLAINGTKGAVGEQINQLIAVSKPGKAFSSDPTIPSNQIDWSDSAQAFIRIILVPQGTAAFSGPSFLAPLGFFTGERTPNVQGSRGSLTQGGSTLTDSTARFDADALIGAILSIQDDNTNVLESYIIVGNTENVITAGYVSANGGVALAEFESETGGYAYSVRTPVLLGEAGMPYSRVYVGEDIRLGYGSSGGSQVRYIKWGYGSPEGVVRANIGSLYTRFDGTSGNTLYVKESGDGLATGWRKVTTTAA